MAGDGPPLTAARACEDAEENRVRQRPDGEPPNDTVFGRILWGGQQAAVLYEDDRVLCFRDISPASKHHYLVIPKRRIRHIGDLGRAHVALLQHMLGVAGQVASANGVQDVASARERGELLLGYHRFPLVFVRHLHLHVIFPAPAHSWLKRALFPQGYGMFFLSPETVAEWARSAD